MENNQKQTGLKTSVSSCDNKWIDFEKKQVNLFNASKGNKIGYNCEKCKNKGVIAFLNDCDKMAVVVCDCIKKRQSIKSAKNSGAWELMKKQKFSNFETNSDYQKEIKQTAQEYTKSENKEWFFIGGQTGAGKTHICTAVFREFFKQSIVGIYCMWRNEVRKLVNSGFSYFEENEKRIELLKSCDVLYIDDLFKTDDSARPERREIELAFEIINSRYNTERVTIISSEMTIQEISNLNQAIAGRILEKSGKYCLNIEKSEKKNYRIQGNKTNE